MVLDRRGRTASPGSLKGNKIILSTDRASSGLSSRSIFHEPWWLEIVTDGRWESVEVSHGGRMVGEMPFYVTRQGPWSVSWLPPMTHTLGPVVKLSGAKPAEDLRHRIKVTEELISKLPRVHRFFQVCDPRMSDALAFQLWGFDVSSSYTFEINPDHTEGEVWSGMRDKTRNLIRRASEQLTVRAITDPHKFVRFYDDNLWARSRDNAYQAATTLGLSEAAISRQCGKLLGAFRPDGHIDAGIFLVWDCHAMYYLLSSRNTNGHNGAVSLLLWEAIREALRRKLIFDFDGVPTSRRCNF
jgi:hypothetical protein